MRLDNPQTHLRRKLSFFCFLQQTHQIIIILQFQFLNRTFTQFQVNAVDGATLYQLSLKTIVLVNLLNHCKAELILD